MEKEIRTIEIAKEKVHFFQIDSFENLRPQIQQQIIDIEMYFQKIISEQYDVMEKRKYLGKLNLDSVSKGSNVGRSTVYNNPNSLRSYISKRIEEIEKEDILRLKQYESLRQKLNEIMEVKDGLELQVVEKILFESKIRELESEVSALNKAKQNALRDKNNLESQLKKLQLEVRRNTNKVVHIK